MTDAAAAALLFARPQLTWNFTGRELAEIALHTAWAGGVSREWAWGSARGAGVRVCVLDSGIEGDHPLVGRVHGSFEVVGEGDAASVAETPPSDGSGHGTACAGIIRSLAPECELYSMRVLGHTCGSGPALLAGLRWAIDQKFDVINLSLSTNRPDLLSPLRAMADDAYFSGTMLVAAAHNLPIESYPWRFSAVVSVGSHDERDPDLLLYNPEPPVEFFAQGRDVEVAWLGGRTTTCTGNSFATPRVTGMLARILSAHPGLTPFQLKSLLYMTADNVKGSR